MSFIKKFLLYFALLIVFTIPSYATFTDGWGEWQDDYTSRGFVHDTEADFTTGASLNSIANLGSSAYQALSYDLIGNSDKELVIISGGNIYTLDSNLGIIDQLDLGTSINAQPSLFINGETFIAVSADTTIHVLNGSLNKISNFTTGDNTILKCLDDKCYAFYNVTNETTTFTEFTNGSYTADNLTNILVPLKNRVPAIEGRYLDRIYFPCDADLDGLYGLCAVSISSKDLWTGFSTDGIIDDIVNKDGAGGSGSTISSPLTYPMDGGDYEIGISFVDCTGGASHYNTNYNLKAFRSDGTEYFTYTIGIIDDRSACTTGYWSHASIGKPNATTSTYYMCGITEGETGSYIDEDRGIFCHKLQSWTATDRYMSKIFNPPDQSSPYPIILADVDLDENADEIITPLAIYNSSSDGFGTLLLDLSSFIGSNSNIIFDDFDNDGQGDIIDTESGYTKIISTSYVNQPPTLTTYNFGVTPFSISSPICIGSTITFSATECGSGVCHYNNAESQDSERLISTCGTNSSYTNGTLDLSNPTLDCYYGSLGTHSFSVYLQDGHNLNNYDNSWNYEIIVFNGTAGVTCNLPASTEQTEGTNETVVSPDDQLTSEAEIQYVVDTLTGQSGFMENLMVLIFTAITIFALVKHGVSNPLIFTVSIFALWIGFALLGILSWVYVMLFAFVAIMLTATTFVMGRKD